MASGIQSTILKTDENFSIITIERVEYNDCRTLAVYNFISHDIYQINFYNKDNLSVSACFINDKSKVEKAVEYCLDCINHKKVISMHHITKIIS